MEELTRSMFADFWKGERFDSPIVIMWQSTEKEKTPGPDESDAASELRDLSPSRIARLPEDIQKKEMERRTKRQDERKNKDLEDIWRRIVRPQDQFQAWSRRISRLDEDATQIEASIKDVVELRARHISLKESHATALMYAAVSV
ncbi:hypothetical protein AC579_10622 [Pseudocercospora musae]|uniref:Uncharacterized protein n=1 Tax=Pseudocercospora musae TaxID=113226 RepID=A0A139ILD5_9PEZI|nr:hypothetical protein AC579_10622 [Pseudocercospora musae]